MNRLVSSTLGALVVSGTLGACATRTVYVIDDRPDPRPAAPAPAPAPAAPPPAAAPTAAAPAGEPPPRYEDDVGIRDPEDFVEPLSPYGRWVHYPGYGLVFVPAVTVVGPRFRPYTHGHWEYTEWGWTWVDHHPFGWATGHYGRWFYDASLGWVWVPGTTWAPAWVTWRTGGGYIGWAPMPPGAVWGGSYTVYETSWVFVHTHHFGATSIGGVIITGPAYRTCYVSTVEQRTTVVYYDRTVYRGPDYDEVRRAGAVIHRPLRETERERPVSRPPAGTVLSRSRDRRDGDARSRDRDGEVRDGAVRVDDRPRDRDDDRDGGAGRPRDRNDVRDEGDLGSDGRPRDRDGGDQGRYDGRDGRTDAPGTPTVDRPRAPRPVTPVGPADGGAPRDRDGAARDDGRGDRDEPGRPVVTPTAPLDPREPRVVDPVVLDRDTDVDRAPRPVTPVEDPRRDVGDRARPVTPVAPVDDDHRAPRPITDPREPPTARVPDAPRPTKPLLDDPARLRDTTRAPLPQPPRSDRRPTVDRSPPQAKPAPSPQPQPQPGEKKDDPKKKKTTTTKRKSTKK